jgi:hypothetical protein
MILTPRLRQNDLEAAFDAVFRPWRRAEEIRVPNCGVIRRSIRPSLL